MALDTSFGWKSLIAAGWAEKGFAESSVAEGRMGQSLSAY